MISAEQVRLRALEREDVKRFYDWVNDPEVADWTNLYLPMSNADEERWFEDQLQRDKHEKPLAIEILDGETWKLVGSCSVFSIDWVNSAGELGIMIGDKSFWNKGYGTQVMLLLVGHCFETLNLNRAFLRVYSRNSRAVRIYQKAGFVEEGRLRQAAFRRGVYDDVVMMSVLRSEWTGRKKEH